MITPKERSYLTLACFIAVAVIIPIAYFGIPEASDIPQHFKFAQIYYDSLTNGDGFPNWAGNENFGYSDVGIRFYPPLEYYFLAVAKIVVGNWYDATWLSFVFWMILGCSGVYFWANCWLSKTESAIAAIFYAVIPSHLNQLYQLYNGYAEFAATSLLTLCFAFITRIFQRKKSSDVFGLAICYALLILTHLPSTIIGSICLLIYSLTFLRKNNFVQPLIKCAVAVGIALSASAFYWVGMITELSWLNHSSERYFSGHFGFDEWFFPLYYHVSIRRESVWIVDLASVISLLLLASVGIYSVYKKQNQTDDSQAKNIYQSILPLALFAFFMATPLSRPIWQLFTVLQKVQLPMRWMPIVSMCSAVVAAASVHYLVKGNFLKKRVWSYICLVFMLSVIFYDCIYNFHPTSFIPFSRDKFEQIISELPDQPSFVCWWAIWSKPEALEVKEKVLAGNRQTRILVWEAEQRVFEVAAGKQTNVRIATFYYPLWQAKVNGKSVEVGRDENGAILIPVGSEEAKVELYFQESQAVRIASVLSLISWLLLGIGGVFMLIKTYFPLKNSLKSL